MGNLIWSKPEIEVLKKNYALLNNTDIVSLLTNKTTKQICLKASNLKLTKQNTAKKSNNLPVLLEDTYETWYWVGFILADGHIGGKSLGIKLAVKDENHLYKFNSYIQNHNKLERKTHVSKTRFGTCKYIKLCIASKIIERVALKFDIKSNKTKNPPDIASYADYYNTDQNLFLALIIGYIDGDGGVAKDTKTIKLSADYSWRPTMEYIKLFLCEKYSLTLSNIRTSTAGLAVWDINKTCCNHLKKAAISMKLPTLQRKWDLIDELPSIAWSKYKDKPYSKYHKKQNMTTLTEYLEATDTFSEEDEDDDA